MDESSLVVREFHGPRQGVGEGLNHEGVTAGGRVAGIESGIQAFDDGIKGLLELPKEMIRLNGHSGDAGKGLQQLLVLSTEGSAVHLVQHLDDTDDAASRSLQRRGEKGVGVESRAMIEGAIETGVLVGVGDIEAPAGPSNLPGDADTRRHTDFLALLGNLGTKLPLILVEEKEGTPLCSHDLGEAMEDLLQEEIEVPFGVEIQADLQEEFPSTYLVFEGRVGRG